MTRTKKIGLVFIIAPYVLFPLILASYGIGSFVLNNLVAQNTEETALQNDTVALNDANKVAAGALETDPAIGQGLAPAAVPTKAFQILRITLSTLGLIDVVFLLVGPIIGVILMSRKEQEPAKQ